MCDPYNKHQNYDRAIVDIIFICIPQGTILNTFFHLIEIKGKSENVFIFQPP